MRRYFIILILLSFLILFCSYHNVWADEISELKTQLTILQEQMKQQNKEIQEMQNKIEKLEAEKASATKTEETQKEDKFNITWKDGFFLNFKDPNCQMKIGGNMQIDSAWFDEESKVANRVSESSDDGEFRQARFNIRGTLYDDFIYKLEYEFVTDPPSIKDAFMGMKNIPYIGTLRVGHMYEPMGLENLAGTTNLEFMEPALSQSFNPTRNIGITVNSTALDDKLTWSTGLFRDTNDSGNISSNKHNWTSRLTFLPWYEDKGQKLFHLGTSYSLRDPDTSVTYTSRPESHLAQTYVTTGTVYADRAHLISGETALVYGPLCLQAEYTGSMVNQTRTYTDDLYFQGGYAFASYFLTGENRSYTTTEGIFGRLKPLKNFSLEDNTYGAWELLCRYSWLDLKDHNISGGILSDVTAGLNWYLNPNMKIVWDYIHSHLNGAGDADSFLTRFQVDF